MSESHKFSPDWISPPGATIADAMKARGIPLARMLEALDLSKDSFSALITGAMPIDEGLAAKISSFVGGTSQFWLARESAFRQNELDQRAAWLHQMPVQDMARLGWIPKASSAARLAEECLSFFGVKSIADWRRRYASQQDLARFRSSPRLPMRLGAVAAWLRAGELAAANAAVEKWDPERLLSLLPYMRALTREKDPKKFIGDLRNLCAKCGVALVIMPTPSGCPVSGVARFLGPDLALVQLSFRYLSDDHFWFTFFHEIGHLILHPYQQFLEGEQPELGATKQEQEANSFSADLLVPPARRQEMVEVARDYQRIIKFARAVGVSPGIVVGQLQHMRILTYRQKNFLKRRYTWE